MSPPEPPKRRPPSSPELTGILTPDQPERRAVRHHPGVEGADQPAPARRGTLPGGMSAIPERLSGEFLPTLPAPNPLQHLTVRRPTPPSAAMLARRTPIPPSDDPPSEETSPQSLQEGQEAALRKALADERERNRVAEARNAELERRERVRTESHSPGGWPPKVEQRSTTPVPSSAPSKTDAAIGKVVRTTATRLAERYGLMPLLLVLGIGGGAVAIAKPSAEPAKVQALEARISTLERQQSASAELQSKAIQREAMRDAYFQCLLEEVSEAMSMLLPAQDRVGNASPMKPWVERCSRLKP